MRGQGQVKGMSKPIVAVVGRPNVGKSTLFNKLIGQRLSIVEDTPGVTRDRIFGDCEWQQRKFTLVDTGGIEPKSNDVILSQMRNQAQLAIDSADVIIMVTDIRTGHPFPRGCSSLPTVHTPSLIGGIGAFFNQKWLNIEK